eukprot:CAMPEP_0172314818 /NCGR_PEP_ID=MMETSP1058-20130122/23351_1 /TAXON_ID=83371 /ORGANISM="Detonula confervacea, Strain CCMP 353" /LENGTH=284 /DNA_ID=CAMNT_0013028765 /DNA_START=133 /DNA_END=984 /DNA_ORIENTATION=+
MQYPNHQPAAGPSVPFPPQPPPTHPPLPPGWEQAVDTARGRCYYANRSTGETSWTPPPYFPPPPPTVLQPPPQHEQQPNQHFQHAYCDQPHMMYAGAQHVVPQPMSQPLAHNMPANNMTFNYSQQYPPNQPQVVETIPSNIQTLPPNPHIPTLQQFEAQTGISHNSSSGLGPSTATTLGMLVPSVRAMINAEYTQKITQQASVPKLELEGLTAGAIADLCNVSKELKSRNVDGGDFAGDGNHGKQGGTGEVDQCYTPLKPFSLPGVSVPPHIEPGRVDIRLHAL